MAANDLKPKAINLIPPITTKQAEGTGLLDVHQVAAYLHVSARWVYERTGASAAHPIPHLKLGKFIRFRLPDVAAWLDNHSRE